MIKRGRIPAGESPLKTAPKEEVDFLDMFESIQDPRSAKNQLYTVLEIYW